MERQPIAAGVCSFSPEDVVGPGPNPVTPALVTRGSLLSLGGKNRLHIFILVHSNVICSAVASSSRTGANDRR